MYTTATTAPTACGRAAWICIAPGDRLSACKAGMRPVGLALKRVNKKYGSPKAGELMLVHACSECGKVSLNRLAADDDPQAVLETFEASLALDPHVQIGAGGKWHPDPAAVRFSHPTDQAIWKKLIAGCLADALQGALDGK